MKQPKTLVKYWAQQKNIVPHDHYVRSQIEPMKLREVYLAADVDALLQQREEQIQALQETQSAEVVDLRAQLAAVTAERDQYRRIFDDYGEPTRTPKEAEYLWNSLKQQLAARERAVWLKAATIAEELFDHRAHPVEFRRGDFGMDYEAAGDGIAAECRKRAEGIE